MDDHRNRQARETEIWDKQLLNRASLESVLSHANYGPARRDRDRFIATAVSTLSNSTVLEIGSQAWQAVLFKNGVHPREVTCINISQSELSKGKRVAQSVGFSANFLIMDANSLAFPDSHFDFVYGIAILHHLDFARALKEIARVTKPGGRIFFLEPLRANPIAKLVRLLTPNARTPDERPLGRDELLMINDLFSTEHLFSELFHTPASILSRFIFTDPINLLTRSSNALDRLLIRTWPGLGLFYRSVLIYGRKSA